MTGSLGLLGAGVISGCGRGLSVHRDAGAPATGQERQVPPEALKDREALARLRRADRFSKLAAIAAWDAAGAAGPRPFGGAADTGLLLTTAFGPHRTTFEFLDDLLDFGEAAASPTKFSHTVHNAAAAYLAMMLECRGPVCTLTDFERPFEAGLRTALLWLREGRCARVLLSCTEEWCDPLEAILAARRCGSGALEGFAPFSLSPCPGVDFCEGSLCLALALPERGGTVFETAAVAGAASLAELTPLLRRLEAGGCDSTAAAPQTKPDMPAGHGQGVGWSR